MNPVMPAEARQWVSQSLPVHYIFIFPVCKWRFWPDGGIKRKCQGVNKKISINPLNIHGKYQGNPDIIVAYIVVDQSACNLIA